MSAGLLKRIWKSLFQGNQVEGELDAEVNSYLEQLTEEKIGAGMSQEQARRVARLELGGVEQVKEHVRSARPTAGMETLLQDIRYGARVLRKNYGFSIVAILTLALGIGVNTAIFSIVHGVLLRPLAFEKPDELVRISTDWTGATDGGVSAPEYLDYKEQAVSLQSIGLHSSVGSMNFAVGSGEPERVPRLGATSSLFEVLGVKAQLGRTFLPEEDISGNHRVLLLSHGLWQRRFGGDPGVIGKQVDVHGVAYTIVGVMPAGFAFPTKETAVWRPLGINLVEANRDARNLRVVARMKPGVKPERLQMEIDTIRRRLEKKYPGNYPEGSGFSPRVYSLREYMVGSLRTPLFVLSTAVGVVLLIACANVANLILARAGARRKELAIRAALGAGRSRLLRQALTESVLLSLIGGTLATLLAFAGLKVLIAASPENIPRLTEVGIERGVFVFTLLISLATGLGVGCAAAWRFYRADPNNALKEGGRDVQGASSQKLRGALVISEVALAATLLLGAGLLVRGFLRLQQVSPGIQPQGVLTATISLLHLRYLDGETQVQFFEQLIDRIAQRSSVQSVAGVGNPPFSGWYDDQSFAIEGRVPAAPGLYPFEEMRKATPDYFRAIGIPILQGRGIDRIDRSGAQPVAVISDSLARKHWPSENPIGKRIKIGGFESESPWLSIVGIVGDVRHGGLNNEIRPIIYLPFAQNPENTLTLVVRSKEDPVALAGALRQIAASMDAAQPLYDVKTMEQAISQSLAQPRFTFRLISLFAVLALILASVGIYGTLAYSIVQRIPEIGMRIALGASRVDILRMVCRDGFRLVGFGLLLGIAGGAAVSRLIKSLLFGLPPFDPVSYIGVPLVILVVSLIAALIPARRATLVDPLVALRYE